jgi:hypothetical protein
MTLLIDAIRHHAPAFDDTTYPTDIYFHLLKRVSEAQSPDALGEPLVHLLAWKDGMVRRDASGPYAAHSSRRYSIARVKPNSLEARHEGILRSEAFFTWAAPIRSAKHFDSALIDGLQGQFPLWKTVVLPVFVLHCLRPPIYPIVDRYVMVAFNVLRPSSTTRFRPTRITVEAYEAYHQWWLQMLKEAEIPQLQAELNELKEIDSGMWALGRAMVQQAKGFESSADEELESTASGRQRSDGPRKHSGAGARAAEPPHGTDSREFKARAIELWKGGDTQVAAIKKAAEEMGISLPPSYSNYPGSHFDRWRKQGFWSREERK